MRGEEVRKDITEGEAGIPLTLAIQVVDYQTCEVVPDAYVDVWSANSTVSASRPGILPSSALLPPHRNSKN